MSDMSSGSDSTLLRKKASQLSRLPYAASTLIEQVQGLRKSAKYESSDTDGFDVDRTITFDKATSKWLTPILHEIEDDRIVSHSMNKDQLSITFSHLADGDDRDEFPLEAAETVASDRQ